MSSLAGAPLPEPLRLRCEGVGRYAVDPPDDAAPGQVVFGGQILAQMIMASAYSHDDDGVEGKLVKSIHVAFARAGDTRAPLKYNVETVLDGRSLGTDTVTCSQNSKVLAEGVILRSVAEPDFIRHQAPVPSTAPVPGRGEPDVRVFPGAVRTIVLPDVDPTGSTPARTSVWTRYEGGPVAPIANQAILAWATDGYLIAAAMRPHAGLTESQAHRTVSTAVVGHTMSFHDPFDATDWLLIQNENIWAGRGRAHGRGLVMAGGALVASFTQDAVIRPMLESQHRADGRRAM